MATDASDTKQEWAHGVRTNGILSSDERSLQEEPADPLMILRVITGVVGLAVWAGGLMQFINGDQVVGGAVILVGGFLIVVALAGGWSHWWEGLSNWIYFR